MKDLYRRIDLITRKWWFIIIFIIISNIPPITSKGVPLQRTGEVVVEILKSAIMNSLPQYVYIIFKVIPIILILLLFILKNKIGKIFTIYVGISYILFAFLQGIAPSSKFGFGLITGNIIMFLIISFSWFFFMKRNNFENVKLSPWKYLLIFLSIIAFWYPLNPHTGKPDFNPLYLITNGAGLAFCMMTPVYLTILLLFYPEVNMVTLRITSLGGLIIGIYNMMINFGINPAKYWWNGTLHLPLLIISTVSLILSFKKPLALSELSMKGGE